MFLGHYNLTQPEIAILVMARVNKKLIRSYGHSKKIHCGTNFNKLGFKIYLIHNNCGHRIIINLQENK